MLIDQHNRKIEYLRLAVTDKCNLRCFYCMPENGIDFWPKENILSYEEMIRLSQLLTRSGIKKIRITGGEPFVRNDIGYLLKELTNLAEKPVLSITTNATLIHRHIDHLKAFGINNINVSLDSLDKNRFLLITRKNNFKVVYDNLQTLIAEGFNVKVNCVVMEGQNIDDLVPLAELTANNDIVVRFLEEMPFNAQTGKPQKLLWNYSKIHEFLSHHFGVLEKTMDIPNSTSRGYKIKGFKGEIGIIPSFSRTFCGTCDRIRISANGDFRTCLYGKPALNLKQLIKTGLNDDMLLTEIKMALQSKFKDGYIAEQENVRIVNDSMAYIGG